MEPVCCGVADWELCVCVDSGGCEEDPITPTLGHNRTTDHGFLLAALFYSMRLKVKAGRFSLDPGTAEAGGPNFLGCLLTVWRTRGLWGGCEVWAAFRTSQDAVTVFSEPGRVQGEWAHPHSRRERPRRRWRATMTCSRPALSLRTHCSVSIYILSLTGFMGRHRSWSGTIFHYASHCSAQLSSAQCSKLGPVTAEVDLQNGQICGTVTQGNQRGVCVISCNCGLLKGSWLVQTITDSQTGVVVIFAAWLSVMIEVSPTLSLGEYEAAVLNTVSYVESYTLCLFLQMMKTYHSKNIPQIWTLCLTVLQRCPLTYNRMEVW